MGIVDNIHGFTDLSVGSTCFIFKESMPGVGGLTYLTERGCAALMGRFFTRNP